MPNENKWKLIDNRSILFRVQHTNLSPLTEICLEMNTLRQIVRGMLLNSRFFVLKVLRTKQPKFRCLNALYTHTSSGEIRLAHPTPLNSPPRAQRNAFFREAIWQKSFGQKRLQGAQSIVGNRRSTGGIINSLFLGFPNISGFHWYRTNQWKLGGVKGFEECVTNAPFEASTDAVTQSRRDVPFACGK